MPCITRIGENVSRRHHWMCGATAALNFLNANAPSIFRTPAWLYFAVAFAITWIMWLFAILATRGGLTLSPATQLVCLFSGSFGPFIGAFFAVYRDGGWSAVKEFASRSLRYRIGPVYLLMALLLMPVLAGMAMWWLAERGGPPYGVHVTLAQFPLLYLELFFIGGSVNEEFGWAYAIDRLQQKRRLLSAAVILGVIWGCWHIPLFFVVGLTQSFMPFWAFLLFTVAFRVVIVWGYENNRKSILVALLFHTASNLAFNLYHLIDPTPQRDERGFIWYCLLTLLVAVVVALTARCYRQQAMLPGRE
jgi:CAAX protease family protein